MIPDLSDFTRIPARRAAKFGMFKSRYGLEHWARCHASIERMQASPGGNVRRYLDDLVRHGGFELACPETGRPVRSGASVMLADKTTVFSFPGSPGLLVAVGDLSMGFPITAVLMTGRRLWVDVAASHWGFAERHLEAFRAVVAATGWQPGPATAPLTLVLGDPNYAHHVWNQLSGLEDLVRAGVPAGDIRLVMTHAPLGPLHTLLPELAAWPVTATPDYHLEAMNAPGALFAPVGGSYIRRSLVDRLFAVAEAGASPLCREMDAALAAVAGPVLWVSVRTRNRTAVNLRAMLAALGGRFLELAPTGAVVIDGHSLACDLADIHPVLRDQALETAARDRVAAEAVRADIAAALGPQAASRVHVAVGLTIAESLLLGRHADFYFCHHGTVQHKVGWFNATPGVVHSNEYVLHEAPGEAIARHSEAAAPALYLPATCVRDTTAGDAEFSVFSHLLSHDNYVFTDIPKTVGIILRHARASGVILPQAARAGG